MKVTIARVCHCVLKNGLERDIAFNTKEDAQEHIDKTVQVLKDKSCKAHTFFVRKEGENFVIDSKFNVDDIKI